MTIERLTEIDLLTKNLFHRHEMLSNEISLLLINLDSRPDDCPLPDSELYQRNVEVRQQEGAGGRKTLPAHLSSIHCHLFA